jgi:hypothetical protein
MRKAVAMSVHGACKVNDTPAARATYAAWFEKQFEYVNNHNFVPASEAKSNAAILYSVKRIIEQTENALIFRRPRDLNLGFQLRSHHQDPFLFYS